MSKFHAFKCAVLARSSATCLFKLPRTKASRSRRWGGMRFARPPSDTPIPICDMAHQGVHSKALYHGYLITLVTNIQSLSIRVAIRNTQKMPPEHAASAPDVQHVHPGSATCSPESWESNAPQLDPWVPRQAIIGPDTDTVLRFLGDIYLPIVECRCARGLGRVHICLLYVHGYSFTNLDRLRIRASFHRACRRCASQRGPARNPLLVTFHIGYTCEVE